MRTRRSRCTATRGDARCSRPLQLRRLQPTGSHPGTAPRRGCIGPRTAPPCWRTLSTNPKECSFVLPLRRRGRKATWPEELQAMQRDFWFGRVQVKTDSWCNTRATPTARFAASGAARTSTPSTRTGHGRTLPHGTRQQVHAQRQATQRRAAPLGSVGACLAQGACPRRVPLLASSWSWAQTAECTRGPTSSTSWTCQPPRKCGPGCGWLSTLPWWRRSRRLSNGVRTGQKVVFSPNDYFSPNSQQRLIGLIFNDYSYTAVGMPHLTGEKCSLVDRDIMISTRSRQLAGPNLQRHPHRAAVWLDLRGID